MFVKHAVLYRTCLARHERRVLLHLDWERKTPRFDMPLTFSVTTYYLLQQVSFTFRLIYHGVCVL
jgi:hypothetical protein